MDKLHSSWTIAWTEEGVISFTGFRETNSASLINIGLRSLGRSWRLLERFIHRCIIIGFLHIFRVKFFRLNYCVNCLFFWCIILLNSYSWRALYFTDPVLDPSKFYYITFTEFIALYKVIFLKLSVRYLIVVVFISFDDKPRVLLEASSINCRILFISVFSSVFRTAVDPEATFFDL